MIGALTVKPLLIAIGALLVALAVAIGTIVVKDARHDAALSKVQADVATCGTELTAATESNANLTRANASQTQVVEDLAGRLDKAITETERLDELLADAGARQRALQAERDTALAQLDTIRETDYANDPSCAAWGAAPVCGRISAGVQERWRIARSGPGN